MPRGQHKAADCSHMSINPHFKHLALFSFLIFVFPFFVLPLFSWHTGHKTRHPLCPTSLAGQTQQLCTLPALVTKISRSTPAKKCHRFLLRLWATLSPVSGPRSQLNSSTPLFGFSFTADWTGEPSASWPARSFLPRYSIKVRSGN